VLLELTCRHGGKDGTYIPAVPLNPPVTTLADPVTGAGRCSLRRRPGHVTERLTARGPKKEESELLSSPKPVLGVPATVHDAAGAVGMVMDTAFPDDLHELPDAYAVT
jgi:hypothetical protein